MYYYWERFHVCGFVIINWLHYNSFNQYFVEFQTKLHANRWMSLTPKISISLTFHNVSYFFVFMALNDIVINIFQTSISSSLLVCLYIWTIYMYTLSTQKKLNTILNVFSNVYITINISLSYFLFLFTMSSEGLKRVAWPPPLESSHYTEPVEYQQQQQPQWQPISQQQQPAQQQQVLNAWL